MWRIWVSALFWGLNWPAVKLALAGFSPWTLRAVGLGLGAMLLAVMAKAMRRSLAVLAHQSFHTYKYPLEVLAKHPETQHAIVDYRELVAEPRRAVSEVYAALGIPLNPGYAALLDEEQARARKHETGHSYSLEEFGLDRDAIERELAELFARYGWGRAGPARS